MGTQAGVYKQPSIPIPEEAFINRKDRRIYVKVKYIENYGETEEEKTSKSKEDENEYTRVVIGRLDSFEKRTFNPNRAFGEIYPHLWKKYYGYDPTIPPEISIGLYAAILGILSKLGLYDLLVHFYDTQGANAIIDYATCSIVTGNNAVLKLEQFSSSNLFLFGDKPYDDSWVSRFLSNKVDHSTNELFKHAWIRRCSVLKISDCWISIDGSNCDCDAENVDYAEYSANSKSGSGKPVIGYIWAVCADGPYRGMPITYDVNSGNMPDCKQQHTVATLLGENGINVKGSLFDRGFCDKKDLDEMRKLKYEFIIMLKKDLFGYKHAFSQCAEMIHEHSRYMISTKGDLFGTTTKSKIFAHSSYESTIGLYDSTIAGCDKGNDLRSEVAQAAQSIIKQLNELNSSQAKIEQNHDEQDDQPQVEVNLPPIPNDYKKYLYILQDTDGNYQLECNCDALDRDSRFLGYWALGSSLPLSAKEIFDKYKLRDSSETQFSILKSQLGDKVMRGHSTENDEGRFLVAFIACIIRSCFMQACTVLDFSDVNSLVKEMLKIKVRLGADTKCYRPVKSYSDDQLAILSQFGVTRNQLEDLTARVTTRYFRFDRKIKHILPVMEKKKRGRPQKDKSGEEAPKRPRGRPRKVQSTDSKEDTNCPITKEENDDSNVVISDKSNVNVDDIDSNEMNKDNIGDDNTQADDITKPESSSDAQDEIEYRNRKIQIIPKNGIGRPPKKDKAAPNSASKENSNIDGSDIKDDSTDEVEVGKRGRKLGTPNRPKWVRDVEWPKMHRGRPTRAEAAAKKKYLTLEYDEQKDLLKYFPDFNDLVAILNKSDEERLSKLEELRNAEFGS